MKKTVHAAIVNPSELSRLRGRVGRLLLALQEAGFCFIVASKSSKGARAP